MADTNRDTTEPLIDALERTGHRYSFFQAVSLLERALDAPISVGEQGPPSREVIRFTADGSMGFAPSDITKVRRKPGLGPDGEEQLRFELETTFLGLYGPSSPLPPDVNEAIVSNAVDSDTLKGFLDVFNNRLIGLIYRIWRRYRHHQVFDARGRDEITRLIASIAGSLDLIDNAGHTGTDRASADVGDMDPLSERSILSNAASVALFCHSASVLERILESSLPGVTARVEEWIPRKATVVEEQRWNLGAANSTLSDDALLGAHVPDVCGKFRIWLGPLDLDEYVALLPRAGWRDALDQLVRRVLRDHLIYDVVLTIRPSAAPVWKLGGDQALGHTAWLGRPARPNNSVAFVGAR
ncbi:MAG: type VI secretion system baseplate subunit TssG [Thalassobaculaceae bacterium]|nr:type VI secretion system baseplate subunit TssG [Thalassobaculaceae bacterium]